MSCAIFRRMRIIWPILLIYRNDVHRADKSERSSIIEQFVLQYRIRPLYIPEPIKSDHIFLRSNLRTDFVKNTWHDYVLKSILDLQVSGTDMSQTMVTWSTMPSFCIVPASDLTTLLYVHSIFQWSALHSSFPQSFHQQVPDFSNTFPRF